MTCYRVGKIIVVCTRGAARARKPESQKAGKPDPPRCRHPGCDRAASQAGWGCKPHWFKLPLDLRNRLYRAAALVDGWDDQRYQAWAAVADEADRHVAEQLARPRPPAWRQPELPL
jgi:hypothetical protein